MKWEIDRYDFCIYRNICCLGLVHMYRKNVDDGCDDHQKEQWQVKYVPQ